MLVFGMIPYQISHSAHEIAMVAQSLVDCRSLGCLDSECSMCKNTPHRRCTSNFAQKYLSGDAIKSKCGAYITIEVIDRNTGEPVSPDAVAGLHLEVNYAYRL